VDGREVGRGLLANCEHEHSLGRKLR
jgi:hypothetical protein